MHKTIHSPRVALYSHDTQGLGHFRRNQAIATALANSHLAPDILLISGTEVATSFTLPPSVDCLTLPALAKDVQGKYRARSFTMTLPSLINLRAQTMMAALSAFAPDVLIVDKIPYGIQDELKAALYALKQRGKTRFVLGLRDILDDPIKTRQEWLQWSGNQAVREIYDAIWVYGDPTVFNPITEYAFPANVAAKVYFTGYLNRCQTTSVTPRKPPTDACSPDAVRLDIAELLDASVKLALCQVGGGQDGYPVARAFAEAALPDDTSGLILTGPFMPPNEQAQLQKIADKRPHLNVVEFSPSPGQLLHRADHVIAMGGYNTTCELLASRKHTLLVPRVKPRSEQWIRAQRLHELGLVDVIHPDSLTPKRVADWLKRDVNRANQSGAPLDMNGLRRIPTLLSTLLERPQHHADISPIQPLPAQLTSSPHAGLIPMRSN